MGVYIPDKLIEELRSNPMDAWDLLEHDDAVTVKAPHGRLVDADEAGKYVKPLTAEDALNTCTIGSAKKLIWKTIELAPTVIEAEVE